MRLCQENEELIPYFVLRRYVCVSRLPEVLGLLWEHLTTTKEEKNVFNGQRIKQENEEKREDQMRSRGGLTVELWD